MALIISHRGNVQGPDSSLENNPKHILSLLKKGIPCEVDLRRHNKEFYLGHDYPQYKISQDFLINNRKLLYIHCKDRLSLEYLNYALNIINLNYFWNDRDKYSLTSQGQVWTNIGQKVCKNSIIVDLRPNPWYDAPCYGICVDYI